MTCLICKRNEADKTGSHIIPHFIIESLVNDGTKGRDKEQSYKFGDDIEFYFGRSVLPEKVEESLGRVATDEDIEANEHHFIRDNVFCSECEQKFAVLESLYSVRVLNALRSSNTIDDAQGKIIYFFWLSIVVRCSVTNLDDFKLEQDDEDASLAVLNAVMTTVQKDIERKCLAHDCSQRIILAVSQSLPDDSRNHVLLHFSSRAPYLLVVNNYLIIFECNDDRQLDGLSKEIGFSITWNASDCPNVQYLSLEEREAVILFCKLVEVNRYKEKLYSYFRSEYYRKNNQEPSDEIFQEFKKEFFLIVFHLQ